MPRPHRWEAPLCLILAALCFVPWVRVPAGVLLLCLVPGAAICRHRLGETDPVRVLALGGLLSLCGLCAVGIPAALLLGQPGRWLAVLTACAVTWAACLIPGHPRPRRATDPAWTRRFAILLVIALLMQIGMSLAMYDSGSMTVRWRGTPDLFFFNGIHTQIAHHVPPMDPERGDALLVHNWIYHFQFALVQVTTGLTVPQMQRLVSAWLALTLLAMVFVICRDLFERPAAGLVACALLMTSGEAAWLIRSVRQLGVDTSTMKWEHSPFGITLLFGWYNLPPLIAVLAAWYFFDRSRAESRPAFVWLSALMCVAAAFFHPVFYGVFMIGFCLWLMRLTLLVRRSDLSGGFKASWLAYLATPIPFFLLYKLPYYGMASPPQVVHPMPGLGAVVAQVKALALVAPIFAALGAFGLLATRGGGPMAWVIGTSLLLRLAVRSPNPHWFTDLVYLFGAIASGLGAVWLARRWGAAGKTATALLLATGAVAFGLHLRGALEVGHTFSADEQAAAGWLRDNTEPDDAIAIHPNSPSSFTVLGLSQRRVLHGWTTHQLDFFHDAREREKEVSEIYTTPDPTRASGLARRLGVQYLYVGSTERACCGREGLSQMCFPSVFSSGDVEILRFACATSDVAAAP